MPDSGGSAPCHQGHMRTFSTVEDTHDLSHDSGTWMEVPPLGGRNADAHFDNHVLRNQVRSHGQFVTVVAVEKDDKDEEEEEEDEGDDDNDDVRETCSVMESSTLTCRTRPAATQPVPKAAPRGFVTVVAVGADSTLHLNHTVGTVTANLKLRLGPSDPENDGQFNKVESDYVNQEMIEKERRASASSGGVDSTADDATPSSVPDQVVVYRLPGERLGLGLKFDGGMGSRECVKRLFIQSVAPDSPAARAAVPWGELHPGDQILNIEGCAVSSMTRVQCVSFLKDAAMKITIGVLKGNGILPDFENNSLENQDYYRCNQEPEEECDSSRPPPLIVGEMRKRVPPPPLPPRSRSRKSPARPPKDALPVPPPPSAFQDMDEETSVLRYPHHRASSLDDGDDRVYSLQRWREMVFARRNRPGDLQELIEDLEFHHPVSWITRRMEDSIDGDLPPIPAFYHDLVGEEDAMGPCESESDETNSSVSTVVDRLSLSSSTTVSRNSSFNATADTSRFDLARALSPFEQLEKELETDNMTDVPLSLTPNTAPRDDASAAPPIDRTTKPPSAEVLDAETETSTSTSVWKVGAGKMKMRPSIKSFSFGLKGRPFSWQQGKTHERAASRTVGRAENFLSIKRHSKRPAPPPPPRSIELSTSQANTVVTVTSNMTGIEGQLVRDDSADYIDMVAEAAKQGITTPVNLGSRKRAVGVTSNLGKEAVKVSNEPKLSPEYLMILNSPVGDEAASEFPSKGFYADIEEDIKKVKESDVSKEESSNSEDERADDAREVPAVVKEKENDYVELVPTSEVESCAKEDEVSEDKDFQSGANESDPQISEEALPSAGTVEIEAQVHHESSESSDDSNELIKPQEAQIKDEPEEMTNVPDEAQENVYEGGYLGESDDNEEESDDANGSDDDDEGSYILEPDLYDDSEGFLSCSSPKISPPILSSRRSLRLPSLIVSEANEMGVYEDLYEAYSSIDERPLDLCMERGMVDRGLPSVPEEDSGDQDDTMEEDPYTLYDDVEEEVAEGSEKGCENEDDNESRKCEDLESESPKYEVIENESPKYEVVGIESPKCEAVNKENESREKEPSAKVGNPDVPVDSEKLSRTISQGYKSKRLRHDIGELIRREMNLEGDVTVEVEEEEEVENLVECANEEELLLVMRALRQDQPGDKLRWLQDDSDDDDDEDDDDGNDNDDVDDDGHGDDKDGGGEAQKEQDNENDERKRPSRDDEGHQKENRKEKVQRDKKEGQREGEGEEEGTPLDPSLATPSSTSRGQSSSEDREVVWARALYDPHGGCGSPPPPPRAPPQTPTSPDAAAAASAPIWPGQNATTLKHVAEASSSPPALNSLTQGSGRRPRHHTAASHRPPPPSIHPPPTRPQSFPNGSSLWPSRKSRDNEKDKFVITEEYEVESYEESEETLEETRGGFGSKASLKALLTTKSGSASAREVCAALCDSQCSTSVTRSICSALEAPLLKETNTSGKNSNMVARTDTNEAGKAATCPDDLQPLSPMQIKQDMEESYVPQGNTSTWANTASSPSEVSEASSSSEVLLNNSAGGSEGGVAEGTDRSSSRGSTPQPPNYSTHPELKESVESQKDFEGDPPPSEGNAVMIASLVPSTKPELIEEESEEKVEEEKPDVQVIEEQEEGEEERAQEDTEEAPFEEESLCQKDQQHTVTGGGGSVSVSSCEHRYTSTGGAPPPYSRLPPDGHEFPSSYAEGLPDKLSRYARYSRLAMELDSPGSPTSPPASTTSTPRTRSAPGTPLGPPPPIPRTSPTSTKSFTTEKSLDMGGKWTGADERKSREHTPSRGRWRRQDERSERSVRDKIAMFSTDGPDQPHPKTRKLDRVDLDEVTMKRAFTEDDVRLENSTNANNESSRDSHNGSRSLSKTSAFSSMINVSTAEPKDNIKMSTASSEVDIRQEMPPVSHQHELKEEKRKEDSSSGSSGLHSRSQSLIDIGRTSLTKRHSVGAYDRPSVYQYGIEKPEERERRTSLSNLIEQRRKSLSKLRGLVIPESRNNDGEKAAIDLPKISSVPPSANLKTMSLPREGQRSPRLYKADSISSIDSCESNTSRQSSLNAPSWKNHSTSTLPKYSPAFKKKNMAVFNKCDNLPPPSGRTHSTRSTSPTSDFSQASPVPPAHTPTHTPTPPRSLETITTSSLEHSFEFCDRYPNDKHIFNKIPLSQKSSLDSRLSRAEDSDNDSAVSSTQSSFSQGMSPPSSPMPEHDDHDDRRYRSYRSRLSPQSSYDEQEAARRVLKRGSIEAENRRNVLNSARVSSGRSSDEQLTPEIIRKFSSDREETDKFPKRLDTELRDGPKTLGLRRHPSTSSTSSATSSRRSSHDSSRRNSRDSVIHVAKHEELKVSAEPVYFDQEGEMYKESQVKVAYLNEIMDDYEQLSEPSNEEVIAEIPMSSSRKVVEHAEFSEPPSSRSRSRKSERWAALEMKYGSSKTETDIESKIQKLRRASDSTSPDRTRKNSNGFKALAERWQQRAEEVVVAPQPQLVRRESTSRIEMPNRFNRLYDDRSSVSSTLERPTRPSRLCDDSSELDSARPSRPTCLYSESSQSSASNNSSDTRTSALDIPRADVPDRKLSMPEYGNSGIKLRERREANNGGAPSRPTSLIEGGDSNAMDSHYLTGGGPLSPTVSTDSRDDLYTPEDSLSRTGSKEVLDAFSRPKASIGISFPRSGASNTPKMSDIMRALERHDLGKRGNLGNGTSHPRMSSLDSTTSDDGCGTHYGSVTSLASGQRDQYGSITSLASSTSLISPQELAQLIEEANQSLEESGTPSHEILVVVLHREIVGHGSIGITLAGGADYEAKEITVHKVIPGSLADRDGRIQRGDRVLSINGKNLRGVTHREALNILKSPRPEVVLVLSRSRSVTPQESSLTEDGNFHRPLINHVTSPRPPKILESPMDSKSLCSDAAATMVPRGPPLTITLMKDGAGLGFSLEGGKDSPLGDRPLTVKKIFSGGAADKGGILKVGDELVSVNTVDVTGMARIEAWNFLKKLPDGTVSLVLRQKLEDNTSKSEE